MLTTKEVGIYGDYGLEKLMHIVDGVIQNKAP
jgi:hypothetical protein